MKMDDRCICGKPNNKWMVCCDGCDKYTHNSCAGLNERQAREMDGYLCGNCTTNQYDTEDEDNIDTNHSLEPADTVEYDVEDIRGFRQNTKEFLVKWVGYQKPTWEPEQNLTKCGQLMNTYLKENNLEQYATYKELAGCATAARDGKDFNFKNWVTVNEVLATVKSYEYMNNYKCSITVEKFTKLRDITTIYLVLHQNHIYVILHNPNSSSYIADGDNSSSKSAILRADIEKMVGLELKPIIYYGQKNIDFCGSSAAMIALEMRRMCKLDKIDLEIRCDRTILYKIITKLHKHESATVNSWRPIENKMSNCDKCGLAIKSHNRIKFAAHVRNCKGISPTIAN